MNIRLIAAIGKKYELGKDNQLLWSLPDDLQYFREKTVHKPIIMGRKTFESIGRPLPKRTNIVVTRNHEYSAPGVTIVHSLNAAISTAQKQNPDEICIIGGAQIYALGLTHATHLSLTHVEGEFVDADTFFPHIEWENWKEISRVDHARDEEHDFSFSIVEYERKHKEAS